MTTMGYAEALPEFDVRGDTHAVCGFDVPVTVNEETLVALGAAPLPDESDGGMAEALTPQEVARFLAYATDYNNANTSEDGISCDALAMTLAAERLMRRWGIEETQDKIDDIDRRLGARLVCPCRRAMLTRKKAELEEKLAEPTRTWTLWNLFSGGLFELAPIPTWEGRFTQAIAGTFHALTEEGLRAIEQDDVMFPMWRIMKMMEDIDIYECDEILFEAMLTGMEKDGLIYDLQGAMDPTDVEQVTRSS